MVEHVLRRFDVTQGLILICDAVFKIVRLIFLQVSSDRHDRIRNCYHDDVGDYMFALLTIRLKSVPKALKALSTVHCCANNLRRTNLQNDLIYGILAQRYDNEQASFYWWMHQEVGNGSLKIEEDGSLKPEVTLRKSHIQCVITICSQ